MAKKIVICERCGQECNEENGIWAYETSYHGLVCEFCHDKLKDYAMDNIEI